MSKLLHVARYEYLRFVRRKVFLLSVLGLPVLLVVIAGVGALTAALGGEDQVIGYVDQAGILDPALLEDDGADGLGAADFQSFESVDEARRQATSGAVAVAFVVPAGYPGDTELTVYAQDPGDLAALRYTFAEYLRAGLAHRYGTGAEDLLRQGPEVTVRTLESGTEISGPEGLLRVLLPFGASFLFLMAAVSSAGYLLQAVSDEKENRTVEILTTSVSPGQLIVGKALGLIGVAGTQLAVWAAGLLVALALAVRYVDSLSLDVPWGVLGLVLVFFVPAYLLLAGIMIAIGAAFPEYRQSQQVVAIVNIFFFIPFFFVTFLFSDPGGTLAVALTLFPTTSMLAVALRSAAIDIPVWQLVLSWAILAASAAGAVWVAPRVFRAGMLRYGQRLDLGGVVRAVRGGGK